MAQAVSNFELGTAQTVAKYWTAENPFHHLATAQAVSNQLRIFLKKLIILTIFLINFKNIFIYYFLKTNLWIISKI
jgi:hypothetical protein